MVTLFAGLLVGEGGRPTATWGGGPREWGAGAGEGVEGGGESRLLLEAPLASPDIRGRERCAMLLMVAARCKLDS